MIFKHKKSGVQYRQICDSFDVPTQEHHRVYMSMETGEVFNRPLKDFHDKFLFMHNPQPYIQPKQKDGNDGEE